MSVAFRTWGCLIGVMGLALGCQPPQTASDTLGEPGAAYLSGGLRAAHWSAEVSGSNARILLDGEKNTYQISLDGQTSRAFAQKPLLRLRSGAVDPVVSDPMTLIPTTLRSHFGTIDTDGRNAYIVQFISQPIAPIQKQLKAMGVTLCSPFPDHAYVVHMDPKTAEYVRNLSFVRWVGHYHPALKVDADLQDLVATASGPLERYSVLLMADTTTMKRHLEEQIAALGGQVEFTSGRRAVLRVDGYGLAQVSQMKDVLFIDRASQPEDDVDIARQIGGVDYLESFRGYTGQGVRAEVMDSGLRTTHVDFQANPPLIHIGNGSSTSHGTSVYGIVFGDGTGDPQARGFLPDAEQPIFSAYSTLGDRMAHTGRLVDPAGPYRAVFQTNSWGDARTFNYTTVSAEMDDILFTHDLLILQSQSNAGNQDSRPQAWAKNILSIGGVRHYGTLDRADDQWSSGASIGPASDGRIKPDLWHFYDLTWAPSSSGDTAYREFSGTSGATPVTAGHMGILFQMWADGVFDGGPGQARDVFDVRPHMTTAKALLINSAFQYDFAGTSDDKTRVHQGWGMPDVGNLHDIAEANGWSLPVLVDESAVIAPLAVHTYSVTVDASSPLRATMVYADPAGNPGAARHRINDLSLRAVSPSGTEYWGNNGLLTSPWSASGGTPNDIDTVENVFIQVPEPGTWTIEVHADEIVQDGHTETGALDADYALVVTHTTGGAVNFPPVLDPIGDRTVVSGDTISFNLTATDPEGSPITYSANPLPANATLDPVTGAFSFTPDGTQLGAQTIVFSASDGRFSDSESVTITVTFGGGYAAVPYSTGFETGLDANWATATSDPNGRIQITGANGPRGTQHLTMDVVTNNIYSRNEAWMHLDLSGQSQVDLSFWWKEFSDENNAEDGVFLSDDAGANFVKVYDLVGTVNNTYAQINLDITALAAANGLSLSNTFVVKFQHYDNYAITTDGFAFDDISVTGAAGNTPPVLDPIGDRTVAEGGTLAFTVSASDADGDAIALSASGLPANASFDPGTGAFSFSPDFSQAGSYTVTFTADDGNGGLDSETITITVQNTNRVPVLDPIGDRSVQEGDTLSFTVSASDADGDTLTLSASPLPTNATFDSGTGAFSFTPDTTQAGTYSVTFSVDDGNSGTDSETITITVTEDSGGYATLPYSTGFESGTLDGFWTTESSNTNGRIQITSANAPRGSNHLTMDVITNGTFSTNEARLHVNLAGQSEVDLRFWWKEFSDETHAEDGVFLSDDGGTTFVKVYDLADGTATYQQILLDIDALAAANGLTLSSTFVIKFQQYDNYAITTDGFGFDDVSVTVGSVNTAPVLDPIGDRTVAENDLLSFTVTANDVDGDSLTYSMTGAPTNASLNASTGAFSFLPSSSQAGTYVVTFTVEDGRGGSDSETVTITVTDTVVTHAPLPYSTGFDSGLDANWTLASSEAVGRIQITAQNGPRSGNHLTMDVSTSGTLNTNEAWMHLDLSGETQAQLSFWWKEFNDEDHPEDGVFLSDDGGATFVKVYDLVGGTATYSQIVLDIDALAAANGLSMSSTFVVKFQQRDNYVISTDGFAFDDVSVTAN